MMASSRSTRRIVNTVRSVEGAGGVNRNTLGHFIVPQTPMRGERRRREARAWVRLKIVGNRTRGGCYKAYIWNPPATIGINFLIPGAVTEAQLGTQNTDGTSGTQGGIEVHAINLAEMDQDTHDLTNGTPKAKIVWGIQSVLTSSTAGDSLPVYEIFMYDWKLACS